MANANWPRLWNRPSRKYVENFRTGMQWEHRGALSLFEPFRKKGESFGHQSMLLLVRFDPPHKLRHEVYRACAILSTETDDT